MAFGDINASVVASLEFDTADCTNPTIKHVTGDYYLIAWASTSGVGELATFTIDSLGAIAAVDTLQFDATQGETPSLVHISDTMWAVCYKGADNDGFIKTFTVSASGALPAAVTATREFDTTDGDEPTIVHVGGNRYAIAYEGASSVGTITVWTIEADGSIGTAAISTNNTFGPAATPVIIHISGDVFAIVYSDSASDGFVRTVTINDSGTIADVDNLEFNTAQGTTPRITHVTGNVYAIAYDADPGAGGHGHFTTVRIFDDGQIADAILDDFEYDASTGTLPDIILGNRGLNSSTARNFVVIASRGTYGRGDVDTVAIDDAGQIAAAKIGNIEFDTTRAASARLVYVQGNIYAIVYSGTSSDGFLVTVNIETVPPGFYWFEGSFFHYIDENGVERVVAHKGGEGKVAVTRKTAAYTTTISDHTVHCDASSAAFTLTLLAQASAPDGTEFRIKKTDSSVNIVTVSADVNIDGSGTYSLSSQYDVITVVMENSLWHIH